MPRFFYALCAAVSVLYAVASAAAAPRDTGPWDPKHLASAPKVQWGEKNGLLQPVYFAGEPYHNQPTRVFAYYARPEGKGPFPAMVLLHGGGGKAFPEWAKLWAERGYVALAIDLAGRGPDGQRLPDGGPDQDDKSKFGDFTDATARDMWTYHAVADAMLGHSLLAAQPEVDARRIGVTGISWGGYLTCIVAGVDERYKVAVPVYGCGFLHENSVWVEGYFNKMSDPQRDRWVKYFDPSSYLANVSCLIFFVNGTNDFAYPPDSYHKSYSLVDKKLRNLRITVNMPHGHPQGWAPPEIGMFVDSVLKDGKPLGRVFAFTTAELSQSDKPQATMWFESTLPLAEIQMHFTTDDGPWQKRAWQSRTGAIMRLNNRTYTTVEIPDEKATYFFTAKDERGAIVSSAYAGRIEAKTAK